MKHYGIWIKAKEEVKDGSGNVIEKAEDGAWAILEDHTIFCTTSKGHAKAQVDVWEYSNVEVREFDDV